MTEQNQTQNQIQNLFFSKDTISGFNKIIHQDQTLQNLSREGKQEIIDLLIKNMKSRYKNIDLWQQLDQIRAIHTVNPVWIRGHAEHPENTKCDEMAVAAIVTLRNR